MPVIEMTLEEWRSEGARRFGPDYRKWKFQCPVCGNVAAVGDFEKYKNQGATPESAFLECIGRYENGRSAMNENEGKPCDYAAYGFFKLGPVQVTMPEGIYAGNFAFADV